MSKKYAEKEARLKLARQIAEEAIVLLKNDGILPLKKDTKVALLGRTQLNPIIGGSGSGQSHSDDTLMIAPELERAGLITDKELEAWYVEAEAKRPQKPDPLGEIFGGGGDVREKLKGLVASGMMYEIFGLYTPVEEEVVPEDEVFEKAAGKTDTAILFIGRASGGEECDRRVEDDYYLTEEEKELLKKTCRFFENVVVVYNVNGMTDFSVLNDYPEVKAVLFMGTSGEQAAGALADILTGAVSPSGKLSQTAALSYEDYPSSRNLSTNKDKLETIITYEDRGLSAEENGSVGFEKSPVALYEEDIYMGYRYFDSFEKPVLYPFGFGLSYTDFEIKEEAYCVEDGKLKVKAAVKNTGETYAGKETVQLYVHAPFGKLKKAYKELKAFEKTKVLQPGECEELTLCFPLSDLAAFDEDTMSFVIEKGCYTVLLGNSSACTKAAFSLEFKEDVTVRKVTADIGMRACNKDKVKLFEADAELPVPETEGLEVLTVLPEEVTFEARSTVPYNFDVEPVRSTLQDVAAGKVTMEQFINQFSVKQLAVLCNGYGPGLPFAGMGAEDISPTIKDDDGNDIATKDNDHVMMGYTNPALLEYGIHSTSYKDGPASVGLTAWPTGMMMGCTFNKELAYEFGHACGTEAEMQFIDSWLAPGIDLIRNPIEGRAFEYYSEDPILTGYLAVGIVRGAEENNEVTTCPKHFALNEQETFRRGKTTKSIDAMDSVVSARAARELYLKPFEMAVTQSNVKTFMSSFNKINGTFAGGHKALCTEILRGEWGFEGVVVTDWGDMDEVVDGADAVAAGNDVIMPGGPPVIAQVLKGYEEGRVTLNEMRTAAANLMKYLMTTKPNK